MCSCRAAYACRHYFFGQRRPHGLGLLSACALNIYFCKCSAACLFADTFDNIVGKMIFLVVVVIVIVFVFFFACSLCFYMYYVYYFVCAVGADTFDNIVGQMVFLVRAVPDSWSPAPQPRALMYPPGSYQFFQLTFIVFSSFAMLNFALIISAIETWCILTSG